MCSVYLDRSLLTHEGSPILYGGILSGQWKPLALNNSDLEAAVKVGIQTLQTKVGVAMPIVSVCCRETQRQL